MTTQTAPATRGVLERARSILENAGLPRGLKYPERVHPEVSGHGA